MNPRANWLWWTVALLGGCAHYQFAIVQPPDAAGPVPVDSQHRFDIRPLQYAVGTSDDRLSIQVENPTDDTVRLIGADSSVVDPAGQSHPLIDQTIAPRSFVRVVLPPLRPLGAGAFVIGEPPVDNDDPSPAYDRASPVYWSWAGVGRVRVHLAYRQGAGSFAHDLTFDRRRE